MYIEAAKKLGADVNYWTRGTVYNEQDNIAACDAFVLVLPSEEFKHSIERLPAGCKHELMLAQRRGKNICLAYRPMTGIPSFYDTSISASTISGIGGSSRMLANTIAKHIGEGVHRNFYGISGTTAMNSCAEVYSSFHETVDTLATALQGSSLRKPIMINVPRI
jgi:hypothetical protein